MDAAAVMKWEAVSGLRSHLIFLLAQPFRGRIKSRSPISLFPEGDKFNSRGHRPRMPTTIDQPCKGCITPWDATLAGLVVDPISTGGGAPGY